ncbi:MAG TPA: dienelactone hydrolase family protein [Chiayiivirga sp.]|nr:dienelactone hydrolase family protein [Chiayiivirga sp.]
MTQTAFDGVEHATGPEPEWSVIWLHGLGADGHDFAPIVPELVRPHWPALRFVFPHAPVAPVTINGGMRMRSWYDILGFDPHSPQDEVGIRTSVQRVEQLIAREVARGIPSHRIVLAGFSQGGAIVLNAGVRHGARLAGIVALSTYLPLAETLTDESSTANRATPIFMAHGDLDPVIALARADASRAVLQAAGYALQWRRYRMQHAVCAEEIADLSAWFEDRFKAAASAPH